MKKPSQYYAFDGDFTVYGPYDTEDDARDFVRDHGTLYVLKLVSISDTPTPVTPPRTWIKA